MNNRELEDLCKTVKTLEHESCDLRNRLYDIECLCHKVQVNSGLSFGRIFFKLVAEAKADLILKYLKLEYQETCREELPKLNELMDIRTPEIKEEK